MLERSEYYDFNNLHHITTNDNRFYDIPYNAFIHNYHHKPYKVSRHVSTLCPMEYQYSFLYTLRLVCTMDNGIFTICKMHSGDYCDLRHNYNIDNRMKNLTYF